MGILITFFNELEFNGVNTITGGFLVLLSAITYASYLLGSGWLIPKFGTLRFTCYVMMASTCCVLVHYAWAGNWQLFSLHPMVYVYGALMAIIATLIPSFLVSEAIKKD